MAASPELLKDASPIRRQLLGEIFDVPQYTPTGDQALVDIHIRGSPKAEPFLKSNINFLNASLEAHLSNFKILSLQSTRSNTFDEVFLEKNEHEKHGNKG